MSPDNIGAVVLIVLLLILLVVLMVVMAGSANLKEKETEMERKRRDRQKESRNRTVEALRKKAEREKRDAVEKERKNAEKAIAEARQEAIAADERARAMQANLQLKRDGLPEKPTASQVAAAVEDSVLVQPHCGRTISVVALVSPTGILIEWKVDAAVVGVPMVTGMCGNYLMFAEFGFRGRHPARLSPGRHLLAFYLNQPAATCKEKEKDLEFEIYIPGLSREPSREPPMKAKTAMEEHTDRFLEQTASVSTAKQRITENLKKQGYDPDEVQVELGRFEGQLREYAKKDRY
jgi:Tfp pilus assembly protein PilX